MTTLAIYSVKKFLIAGDGRYYTYGGFGEYVNAIAPRFDKVLLCIHARKALGHELAGYYPLNLPNVQFRELPWYMNELECLLKLPWMLMKSVAYAREADIINARVPDYSGICGAFAAWVLRKPIFYNVIGDWASQADFPATRLKGLMKKGLVSYLRLYVRCEEFFVHKSLAFVQGESAFARYRAHPKAYLALSTSITDTVISRTRRDACAGSPVTILSVGRLQREKGHLYLLEAFRELRKNGVNARLKFIGTGPLRDELLEWVHRNRVESEVEFLGLMTHGPELFEQYRLADIFVLPSISEGTPKVLLEAMASGLPVIAAEVGGVPSLITHKVNGFLVPRQDPKAICAAVEAILADAGLRARMIEAGYASAAEHTNKKEMDRIMAAVRDEYPALFN